MKRDGPAAEGDVLGQRAVEQPRVLRHGRRGCERRATGVEVADVDAVDQHPARRRGRPGGAGAAGAVLLPRRRSGRRRADRLAGGHGEVEAVEDRAGRAGSRSGLSSRRSPSRTGGDRPGARRGTGTASRQAAAPRPAGWRPAADFARTAVSRTSPRTGDSQVAQVTEGDEQLPRRQRRRTAPAEPPASSTAGRCRRRARSRHRRPAGLGGHRGLARRPAGCVGGREEGAGGWSSRPKAWTARTLRSSSVAVAASRPDSSALPAPAVRTLRR